MNHLPQYLHIKNHVIKSLSRYWPKNQILIKSLPIIKKSNFSINLPLELKEINMPTWSHSICINNKILVPKDIVGNEKNWKNIDWFLVLFVLLENTHERKLESIKGPIHSYSF